MFYLKTFTASMLSYPVFSELHSEMLLSWVCGACPHSQHLRQEGYEFKVTLASLEHPFLKQQNNNNDNSNKDFKCDSSRDSGEKYEIKLAVLSLRYFSIFSLHKKKMTRRIQPYLFLHTVNNVLKIFTNYSQVLFPHTIQ